MAGVGSTESLLHNRHAGSKGGARCGCRHSDVRGFFRVPSSPSHPGFRWMFLRKRHVFRFSGCRYQSLGANIPAQGAEDAPGKRQNHAGYDHAIG